MSVARVWALPGLGGMGGLRAVFAAGTETPHPSHRKKQALPAVHPNSKPCGAGSFALRTCPHFRHVLTRSSRVDAATQHGAFPLRSTFWVRPPSPLVRRRSGAFCSDPVPEYLAPIRLLAPLRSEFRLRLYPPLPSGVSGRALRCLFLAFPIASVARFLPYLPDGRDQASVGHCRSPPPCRPHPPWCDGLQPMCLRPHSAGSTTPPLR